MTLKFNDMVLLYWDDEDNGYMYYAIPDGQEIPIGYEVLDYRPSFAPITYARRKKDAHLTH